MSIDTRTLVPGDLFFAILGNSSDGHDYVRAAFEKGAAAAVVDEAHVDALAGAGPLYVVRDTLAAMRDLGVAARARAQARVIAVTGSARGHRPRPCASSCRSSARLGRLLQQSLGRAAVAGAHARDDAFRRVRDRHKSRRRDHGLDGQAACRHRHHGRASACSEHFASGAAAIAEAKGKVFSGLMKGGVALINRDIDEYSILERCARHSPAGHILSSASMRRRTPD